MDKSPHWDTVKQNILHYNNIVMRKIPQTVTLFKIYVTKHIEIDNFPQLQNILHSIYMNIRVLGLGAMVFNATSNNILFILWRSALLVEEIGVYGENHRPVASY